MAYCPKRGKPRDEEIDISEFTITDRKSMTSS